MTEISINIFISFAFLWFLTISMLKHLKSKKLQEDSLRRIETIIKQSKLERQLWDDHLEFTFQNIVLAKIKLRRKDVEAIELDNGVVYHVFKDDTVEGMQGDG